VASLEVLCIGGAAVLESIDEFGFVLPKPASVPALPPKGLFGRTLAKADARAAAVLVDEFDAGSLQCPPNRKIIGDRHRRMPFGKLSTPYCTKAYR
jgi:hypothetical protein